MKKKLAMLLCLMLLLCPALPVFAEGAAMVTIEKTQYDASLERLELTRGEDHLPARAGKSHGADAEPYLY